jgi:hypothetical protein
MATFGEQIQALTGFDGDSSGTAFDLVTFQNLSDQWLTEGAKEVLTLLPDTMLEQAAKRKELNNDTGFILGTSSAGNNDNEFKKTGRILYVTRNDSNYDYPCRLVSGLYGSLTSDSSNLTYYATDTDPVYFIRNNILEVKPNPDGTEKAYVYYVSLPSIVYSDSNIDYFPAEAEYLVSLYASIRACLYLVAQATIAPTPSNASDLTSISATTSNQTGTDSDFLEYDMWFSTLSEMIEDDEDIELAMAQIEKINSYTGTYNIQLQSNIAKVDNYLKSYASLKSDYATGIAALTGAMAGGGGGK